MKKLRTLEHFKQEREMEKKEIERFLKEKSCRENISQRDRISPEEPTPYGSYLFVFDKKESRFEKLNLQIGDPAPYLEDPKRFTRFALLDIVIGNLHTGCHSLCSLLYRRLISYELSLEDMKCFQENKTEVTLPSQRFQDSFGYTHKFEYFRPIVSDQKPTLEYKFIIPKDRNSQRGGW